MLKNTTNPVGMDIIRHYAMVSKNYIDIIPK
jgi:hypothetical protein